jgi:ABC-type phosphate/phosphonate transport system substrate-binding protein
MTIANARMYSVDPVAADLWHRLLAAIANQAGVPLALIEHPAPAPMADLWRRPDKGAVFMCGLPFALADPPPVLVAAPVPAPAEFGDRAEYWSEFVVRADSDFKTVDDTFGHRIAFTVPDSQSGCVAALHYFRTEHAARGAGGPAPNRAPMGRGPPDRAPMGRRAPEGRPPDRVPLYREVIAPTITPLGALTAVVQGAADVAPIDAYAFALLQKYRSDLTSRVRVVGRTVPTAIPPLVASQPAAGDPPAGQPACDALQAAFLAAHRDPAMSRLLDGLALRRFARPDSGAYAVLRERYESAARFWNAHALATIIHPAFVTHPPHS